MVSAFRTVAVAVMMIACAAAVSAQTAAQPLTAAEAVRRSIASPAAPLPDAWIEMTVCGAGADGPSGFLNSKEEYRDRASLNVELIPPVRAALAARFGGDPIETLYGERIRVYGAARQVRITLYRDGVAVGAYFQTQLRLASAGRLELAERDADLSDGAACGPVAV